MGPTTKAISVTGGVTFDELIENYRVQALGLMAGGADYLLLETCQDTRNVKAGLLALQRAFDEAGWALPVAVSVTIESTGTMLGGQDAEALAVSLMHADLLYLGLNCATGPELMTEHVRTLSELARTAVACVPNAGLPDEEGEYHEGPEVFRAVLGRFLERGWLNLVGGCCGSTTDHVATLAALAAEHRPRPIPHHQRALVFRSRGGRADGGQPTPARGRADQRPGKPEVQAPRGHRRLRSRGRGRARPGTRRSAGARRVHAGPPTATRSPTSTPSSSA